VTEIEWSYVLRAFDKFDEIKIYGLSEYGFNIRQANNWSIRILASHASRLQIDGLTVQLAIWLARLLLLCMMRTMTDA